MSNALAISFVVYSTLLRGIEVVEMYFAWGKINHILWWAILVILIFFYFGSKTYHMAVADKSEPSVIRFWYVARSVIFILDTIFILVMAVVLII